MKTTARKLAIKARGCLCIGVALVWMLPGIAAAQMLPWDLCRQEELARQNYERQQWLQYQQQEQMRQTADRQQWLQWQQQEKIRQMYQR